MKLYWKVKNYGSEYFLIINGIRDGKHPLKHFLDQFNIDEYIIYKGTNCFRKLTPEQLKKEKYARYLFINKNIYNDYNFNLWLDWIKGRITINFLDKPFPNFDPFEKIKEIEL